MRRTSKEAFWFPRQRGLPLTSFVQSHVEFTDNQNAANLLLSFSVRTVKAQYFDPVFGFRYNSTLPLDIVKNIRVQWGKTCVYLAGQTPQTTQVALHFHCCLCGWLSCFHNNTGVLEVRSTGCNDFLWRLSNIWIDNHHNRSFRRASRWAMAGQPSRITLEYGHFRSRGVRYKGTWL